jgi:hypothetical protein
MATSWRDVTVGVLAGLRRGIADPRGTIRALAATGATETVRAKQRLDSTVDELVALLARSPVLDRVVDRQLERVLRPLVSAVLDDVLEVLEREPDRIRSLVRSQRTTMVDELVGRIRAGANAGDDGVDRLLRRPPAGPG